LLVAIIHSLPAVLSRISKSYYHFLLETLLLLKATHNVDGLKTAIIAPLVEHIELEGNDELLIDAYISFALKFLTQQDDDVEDWAPFVNVSRLSTALIRVFSRGAAVDELSPNEKLSLLAHFIALHRIQQGNSQAADFLRALSLQLSSSSAEIIRRIDFTSTDVDEDQVSLGLDSFVKKELMSLVDQESITGLLEKFNIDYAKPSAAGEEDASLLASYALTLLRIFPRRSDEIRMWLSRGSITTTAGPLPAVKFFWKAMASTNTFLAIKADSKTALTVLQPQVQTATVSSSVIVKDREWRTILLFLELYSFVLRFTDDEEFLSGGVSSNLEEENTSQNARIRESALPLHDVKQLTVFLKNLAFTAYYNSADLSDDDQHIVEQTSSLNNYFATNIPVPVSQNQNYRPFAGIAGMKFGYVRTIVAGVMRMLYERDSRRRFLPKGHWLMTSLFDMEGFIPAVVAEEERRQELDPEDDEGMLFPYSFVLLIGFKEFHDLLHILLAIIEQCK
jgi:ubiquitin-protein ligase E3 C